MATRKSASSRSAAGKTAKKTAKKTTKKTVIAAKPVKTVPGKAAKKATKKAIKKTVRKTSTGKTAKKTTAKVAKKISTKKTSAKVAKKIARKAPAKKSASTSPGTKKSIVRKTSVPTAAAAKKPSRGIGKPVAKRMPEHITPEQALANTLALLEAKNEKAKQPPIYPSGGDTHGHSHEFLGGLDPDKHIAPGVQPEATEGHSVGRGNQGKRSQS